MVDTEGLWYLGSRRLELRPMKIPDPGPHEVLVELEACGICGWDIEAYTGRYARHHPYPFCAGHEGVGRVVGAGDAVAALPIGARVAMHELPIGVAGGALMARHALRADTQVALIPDSSLPVEQWIVEPVVCVLNGIVHCGLQPADRVAVVGTGYMGSLFIQGLARSLVGELVAIDIDPVRLSLARDFGAARAIDPETARDEQVDRCDIVIETAGRPESLELAQALLKPGAVLVPFAWHHHDQSFDLERWHMNSWRILNLGPEMNLHFGDLYPRTIALMANGTFSNERLVTHVAPVEQAAELFAIAAERSEGYIKGVVKLGE